MTGSAGPVPGGLARAAGAWAAQDPEPRTRAALDDLVRRASTGDPVALAELTDAFAGRLEFGTAGLRGALGPGPNRMNRVVVGQAAAGLARYLQDQGLGGGRVIIGYDARFDSDRFAADTAEIMAGAGFEALLAPEPLPTPVLAFGIRHFACVAGVVVTASHNPPQDNGYKVYLGDGSQIVPPADTEISARIAQVAERALGDVPRSQSFVVLGEELVEAYLDRAAGLVPPESPRALDWVYTPLHGVGRAVVEMAVARSGFRPSRTVAEQADPDPRFPTVSFPNPEEPGVIDLAVAAARASAADLVVANDPDADRCAVAAVIDGDWRMLSGDELGALLAEDALQAGRRGTYACSIVSSSLLQTMAAAHDQPFTYTLTGFKWIGRVPGLAFGYEEAIGYCVDPEAVPDKDGITALLRVLAAAAALKAAGLTVADRLDEIARTYGVYETAQLSVRVSDLSRIAAAMTRVRKRPPTELTGEPVEVRDLSDGAQLGRDGDLPPTDAVLITGPTLKVVVRPSGTEPKLKCYLEARRPADPEAPLDIGRARAAARAQLQDVRSQMSAVLDL